MATQRITGAVAAAKRAELVEHERREVAFADALARLPVTIKLTHEQAAALVEYALVGLHEGWPDPPEGHPVRDAIVVAEEAIAAVRASAEQSKRAMWAAADARAAAETMARDT